MRILWHSNSPGSTGGYGIQTQYAVRALADLGHDVVLSCWNFGAPGANLAREWEGHPILPGGFLTYGNGVVREHYRRTGADLLLTLIDVWVLEPSQLAGLNVACWQPIDTTPLGAMDALWLTQAGQTTSKLTSIAMSRHGQAMLTEQGFACDFVQPHCVDTDLFCPPDSKLATRRRQGIPDKTFIAVMVADNKSNRKAHYQQLEGFARFHAKHKDSVVRIHCDPRPLQESAYDLFAICAALGIQDAVEFADPYLIETGQYPAEYLASLYQTADVLLGASMAEGFGLPLIEAQACGTPVIATRASAMTELVPAGTGWLVNGSTYWCNQHAAAWVYPSSIEIARQLEKASAARDTMSAACRKHALTFDYRVTAKGWAPIMEALSDLASEPV